MEPTLITWDHFARVEGEPYTGQASMEPTLITWDHPMVSGKPFVLQKLQWSPR